MESIFQPGACWLAIVDNRCTVLRIDNSTKKYQFPGETNEHSVDRVQEWLAPVWTATMLKYVQGLERVAKTLEPVTRPDLHDEYRNAVGSPRPMSYWIGYVDSRPEVLLVVEDGVQLHGKQGTYPMENVREWLLPIWSPEMAYCPGCCQAQLKKDIVFFFRGSPKGVCKECSENLEFEKAGDAVSA
jgi:hypothetical protein